ncbi:hypothetical protein AVEN_199464-1 [Araneus ventricosus]|uniref:Uncharacterized protein n=1 Tax=Araneus ventricosus TaxID=182803 RepID=A0A4Y2LCP9_ARAVE|nr:hypothetical protein AVEN_199464-1 [Araneus ventricosus]
MYVVNVKDSERFYPCMLLLHVPGATSLKFFRTVDNIIYDAFNKQFFTVTCRIQMKSGIIAYTTLPPIKCQNNYVRPSTLFCASVTRQLCSRCGTNTRSICLSIICTTSKQLL